MVSASFVQTSFLGGEWSPFAQGRMTDPAYKSASNVMLNAYPLEAGAWVRRSGLRFLAHTKAGRPALLRAFDFSVTQPYQIEFTDGFARFYAGLSLLTTLAFDGAVYVDQVSNTNPATVYLSTAVPAGWANGNTILFRLPTVPVTCPLLLGRQFVIANLDTVARTFTLQDPITGADIDGTGFGYTPSGEDATPDTVEKIFELVTPYVSEQWRTLRSVHDDTTVLLLHKNYQQRLVSNGNPFSIAPQDFSDGPYLDINDTDTTLTPDGTTGTINITANSTTGINSGSGFVSTDVGRLIRFQGGPAAWSNAVSYAKAALVTGSDNNIYTSNVGDNLGNDPTTDDSTNWTLAAKTITWTWLKITNVTSTTVVVCDVMGVDLPEATATTQWQLGLYSDTTGWPTCGTYHEGRLWLSGVISNRWDASKSNDHFNFEPTATDGTVADDNALAIIANATDVNQIFWMISTEDGLISGTQAGEWRIKASALDDPISPTSVQARRISTYGCADIEPVQPGSQTVFVQRQQRRLLAHEQVSVNTYMAANLTQNADHQTTSGIAEVTWQQEPLLSIWMRREDGTLIGCTYQKRQYAGFAVEKEPYNAVHQHELANDRSVTSIQGGPAFDGLSDALYMVTNQIDSEAPDYNVHWVQVLMPLFESGSDDWMAFYTDGGGNPPYAQLFQVVNEDSFDGIRIYGLWPLNGQTVAPVVGGLDLGDRTVANGFVEVPFGTDPDKVFTLAFFLALSDGTDYGIFGVQTGSIHGGGSEAPPVDANNLLAYVGPDDHVIGSRDFITHIDAANNRVFEMQTAVPGNLVYGGGIRQFNATTGDENVEADNFDIFGSATSLGAWSSVTTYTTDQVVTGSDNITYRSRAGGNLNHDPVSDGGVHWEPRYSDAQISSIMSYLHRDGHIYTQTSTQNTATMAKISASDLTLVATYGAQSSSLAGSSAGNLQCAFYSMAGPRVLVSGVYQNYLVFVGIRSGSTTNEITLIQTDDTMNFVYAHQIDEANASVCNGTSKAGVASWFVAGQPPTFAAVWAVGTTYLTGNQAFGSNGVLYQSLSDGNVGNDPTVDGGVHWTAIEKPIGLYQCDFDPALYGDIFFTRKITTVGPRDIDATWNSISDFIGPAYDKTDQNLLCLVETADAVTNSRYLVKFSSLNGEVLWACALDDTISTFGTKQSMSVADVTGTLVFMRAGVGNHNAYIIDTSTGDLTMQPINTGFAGVTPQYYDPGSGSITFFGSFSPPGTGPVMQYIGTYLADNADTLTNQWGRLYLGVNHSVAATVTTYTVPVSLGSTYTSRGQLLRPDFGPDAGARNGPAFGKKRRLHWYAGSFYRSRAVKIGTTFDKLRPVPMETAGGTPYAAPTLFSGIVSTTLESDYTFDGQIAWEVTRPYPCNISAMGGYIEAMDK